MLTKYLLIIYKYKINKSKIQINKKDHKTETSFLSDTDNMKVKRGIVCCPMRCNRKYTPSTTKYSCTRSNNKGPDLIKPVDLTTVYRKYRGWKNMLIPPCRCSQPNPKCGKFQRTLDPVSSISKQQEKKN